MSESQQLLPWKARRYCSGDESWTDWRLISQAEFEHRKDDPSFEFLPAPSSVAGHSARRLIHGERPTVRAFQEWLNNHRDADVSSVFHEIVAKYRELADSSESLRTAPVCPTLLGDASPPVAEWVNQEQGFQYLVEPSLPDGTLLYRAAQPTPSNDFAIKFIEKRAQDYLNDNTSSDPDDGSVIWHYGDAGREYHETLVELAEDIQSALEAARAQKAAECRHRRMTTTALGAATNTGWKCADCGTLLSSTDAPDRAKPRA